MAGYNDWAIPISDGFFPSGSYLAKEGRQGSTRRGIFLLALIVLDHVSKLRYLYAAICMCLFPSAQISEIVDACGSLTPRCKTSLTSG